MTTTELLSKEKLFEVSQDEEPQSFAELKKLLSVKFPDDSHLVGDSENLLHVAQAAQILAQGEPHRIVGTLVGGKVGGILFPPHHRESVGRVINIKSSGGQQRQALFALVCPEAVVKELIDHDRVRGFDYAALTGYSFIQLPAKASVKNQLPQAFWKEEEFGTYLQFFIPETGSILEKVVEISTKEMPLSLMAGTSANYTRQSSRMTRDQAAIFCLENGIYWLDASGHPDMTRRGSYPIVKVIDGQMIEERQGNTPFPELQQRVASG